MVLFNDIIEVLTLTDFNTGTNDFIVDINDCFIRFAFISID